VNHEQNRTQSDHANGNSALFVLDRFIPLGDGIWIVENQNGGLKTNVVCEDSGDSSRHPTQIA